MKAPLVALAFLLGFGSTGCEKAAHRPDESLSNQKSVEPGAARPMPVKPTGPSHFNIDCFDAYATCRAVRGLPAVSRDGTRIAIAETGEENARDEFVLTVVYLDSATGADVQRVPIMTLEDRVSGLDPDTEAMSPALRKTLEARVAAADASLHQAGFQALLALGVVDAERPGEPVAGLRASFDGTHLTVAEGDAVQWRESVHSSLERAGEAGCSSGQIAEIAVWVRRSPSTLLARVGFTTAHMCDVSSRYQSWRR